MNKLIFLVLVFLLFPVSTPVYADAETDYQSGLEAYKKGNYNTAFAKFKSLAEQGDAISQFNLGVMYGKGRGVNPDYI